MISPGVVAVVLTKWGSLAKAPKVATSSGGLDVGCGAGGDLPSQAASHVASGVSLTLVPTEQSIVTQLLPNLLLIALLPSSTYHLEKFPWTSLRTALGATLRTALTLLLASMVQLDMMVAIFLSSGCVGSFVGSYCPPGGGLQTGARMHSFLNGSCFILLDAWVKPGSA